MPNSSTVVRVQNPATGVLFAEVPSSTPEHVTAAVTRARAAQPAWARLPFKKRAAGLRRLAGLILRDEQLLTQLIGENGKSRFEAEAIEIFYTCELTRMFTGSLGRRALADDVRYPFIFRNKRARVVQHPHGVVGVIGPWNWPLLNNYADCVAPLIAGNAVVLKPSHVTPLTSLRVAELWKQAGLPEDVFQVVAGGGDAGSAVVDAADMIFFTGSQNTGRMVARRCGERLIPCVLELGGKSPFIVLADAHLEAAARAAVWGAFANSGQVCIRPERMLVAKSVSSDFAELCRKEMTKLRQGANGSETGASIDVGAMTFMPQVEKVEALLADAVGKGARILAGGKRRLDLAGCFFEPTLLVDVTPQMNIAREEAFGPVLAIFAVEGADEALRIANESGLGLSASVWSRNTAVARSLARKLEVGSVCVNDVLFNYFCVEAPLGGVKGSGLGVRHGPEGLRQFCRVETIVEDLPGFGGLSRWLGRQLMFPYQSRILQALRFFMRRLY